MPLFRDFLYHIIFALILTFYSVQVCPHVSKLGMIITAISFTAVILPMIYLRRYLVNKFDSDQIKFSITFFHFITIGIITGLYNYSFREFPIESTFKIITGAIILGVLNSTIFQLESPQIFSKNKRSFLDKILAFAILNFTTISIVWILLVVEDINIFNAVENGSMIDLRYSIVIESIFVWLVLLSYLFRIVTLYRSRLKTGIEHQLNAMKQVRNDNLEIDIPLFSNDEFATIGEEVNEMILRLREGKKIKEGFEKIAGEKVSDEIVQKITNDDFSSEKKNVAVLFSDIVGFTKMCQTSEPNKFVKSLNDHFEDIVKEVNLQKGHLNKFIGDAVLVYFEGDDACKRAYETAINMVKGSNFKIGIGLHYGEVLAGLIGSSKRMEYTIIGSTVNLAARLESETRNLEASIVFSEKFAKQIDPKKLKNISSCRTKVKGFDEEIQVFYS